MKQVQKKTKAQSTNLRDKYKLEARDKYETKEQVKNKQVH